MKKLAYLVAFFSVICSGCDSGIVENDVVCDSEKEVIFGDRCECNEVKGYFGIAGSCEKRAKLCNPFKEVFDGYECKCNEDDGYLKFGDKCEKRAACVDEESVVYNSQTNTCDCNESAGYHRFGDSCEQIATCSTDESEIYNPETNRCDCNELKGYIRKDGKCELDVTCSREGEYYDSKTDSCKCNENSGYYLRNGQCTKKLDCLAEIEVFDPLAWTCKCNEDEGYYQFGDKCERLAACVDEESVVYNPQTNTCDCNESAGYHRFGDNCEQIAICLGDESEIYNPQTNRCDCNTAKGYYRIGDACVHKTECDSEKEKYDPATNNCLCNENGGYTNFEGECVLKPDCNTAVSFYNASTNRCECNDSGEIKGGYYEGKCYYPKDELSFGRYLQASDVAEPVVWTVLESSVDELVLISKYALDVRAYNEADGDVSWETCTLRSWLNGYDASVNVVHIDYSANDGDSFIGTAFTPEEREKIKVVKVENPDTWGTDAGEDTNDRIYLLSLVEAQSYFPEKSELVTYVTPYGLAKGADVYLDACTGSEDNMYCTVLWWLRSPGYYKSDVSIVSGHGSISISDADSKTGAVRPALHLDLTK